MAVPKLTSSDLEKDNLGKIVRSLREQQGITQFMLAKRSDVSLIEIKSIEQGLRRIRVETMIAVFRGLGYDMDIYLVRMPDR